MMVLVDTSVWSLALRRSPGDLSREQELIKQALGELISEGRAHLIGPIRQEILSGIREESQYRRLRDHLRAFDDAALTREDYEQAALVSNQCRAQGVAGSAIDFLMCATALRRNWQIFTTDQDFRRYAKLLPVGLYRTR